LIASGEWTPNQPNTITFVLVDTGGVEVAGRGATFALQLAKAGGAFVAGVGTKREIGLGWYAYITTADEANTIGPVSVVASGSGLSQQNMEYVVGSRVVSALEFTYTVTNTATGAPLANVKVVITTDVLGVNIVWYGVTDTFGVARDLYGAKPRLEAGQYFIFRELAGFNFANDPDIEQVGA